MTIFTQNLYLCLEKQIRSDFLCSRICRHGMDFNGSFYCRSIIKGEKLLYNKKPKALNLLT